MNRLPALSAAIPPGRDSCASVAGPPSPENPGRPLPTTVGDHSVRRYLADAIPCQQAWSAGRRIGIAPVQDEQVALPIYGKASGKIHLRFDCGSAIA